LGTALGHWNGYVYYFEGMMYGFNWGVVSLYYPNEKSTIY